MSNRSTLERETTTTRRETKPPAKSPRRRPSRVVRWLEWLVIIGLVIGAGAIGYRLLSNGDSAEVRADLLGTRYRETGVVMQVEPTPQPLPDPADVARLTAITDSYRSQIAEP